MENEVNINEVLKKIYYGTSDPGSFGGVERLYKAAIRIDPLIKRKNVKDWLKSQLVYTLHKQKRNRIERNPVFAEFPNENYMADLINVEEISKENDGFKYLLTIIDVFTKKAWCVPTKNKEAENVTVAMETVIGTSKPSELMTDEGTEFKNAKFSSLMKKYDINHFFAKNKAIKCSVVEIFNRTLRNRIQKYITLTGKSRYIDELKNIVESYNNSYHRSIKMAPNEVNVNNSKLVLKNLYGVSSKREYLKTFKKPKISIGSLVRTAYLKKTHDRGRYPNWSDQTFSVYKSMNGSRKPYYRLKDTAGNISKKRYYPEEIQVIKEQPYRIEKILKERIRKGRKEFFVKWLNYSDSYNSWTQASNVTNING